MSGLDDDGVGNGGPPASERRSLAGRCRDEGGPPPLRPRYAALRDRSYAKCLEAIESLEAAEPPLAVSLDAIHRRSVELCAARGEPGIAVSTILNNPRCERLYLERRTVGKKPRKKAGARPRSASGRLLRRENRMLREKGRILRRDLASLAGERARRDREEIDGPDRERPPEG